MRKGAIVLFTDGLFGLRTPQNLGVVLNEYKQKKTRMVRLLTVEGQRSAAKKQVRSVLDEGPVGPVGDESALMKALKDRIDREGGGGKGPKGKAGGKGKGASERFGRDPDEIFQVLDVRALWKKVAEDIEAGRKTASRSDAGDTSTEEDGGEEAQELPEWYHSASLDPAALARAMWGPREFTRAQLKAVDRAVSEKEKGRGYFSRRESAGEVSFHPLKAEVASAILSEAAAIRELRNAFVRRVEDGEGNTYVVPLERDLSGVELPEHLRDIHETTIERMRHFVLNDRWTGAPGFAGTGLQALGEEDLGRITADLARDLAGDIRLDISSACLETLIGLGEVTWEEAGRMLVTRSLGLGEFAFSETMPDNVSREGDRIPGEVGEEDMVGRRDLRELETYTIDPPDARDFDDAVSVEKGDDGAVTLWVHIADVSHYVHPGSHLDEEARRRATSVYLPTAVLPMLPPKLSEDLCSLREGVPRLAMTVRMEFKGGERVGYELMESVVQVDSNLSYDTVLGWFDEGREPFASLFELSDALQEARGRPGIETPERRVRYGEDGNSITPALKRATAATSMIEMFMVAANEAAAEYLRDNDVPGVYRVHPLPARADIERFNRAVDALGLDCPINIDYDRFTSDGPPDGEEDGPRGVDGEAGAKSRRGRESEAQQAGEDAILAMLKSGGKFSLIPGAEGTAGQDVGSEDEDEGETEEGGEGGDAEPGGTERTGSAPDESSGSDEGGKGRGEGSRPPLIPLEPEKIEHYSSAYADALNVINSGDDRVFQDVMNLLVLRTMPRAFYTTANIGHFGLKSMCYTHFTSPIRRYPDVLVHRAVRALLRDEEPPHSNDEHDEYLDRCNDQAESAEKLEYAMTDCALAILLSRGTGDIEALRRGIVSSLAPSAMFVALDHGVEGRIPISKLSEGRPVLDESETSVVLSTLENPRLAMEGLEGTRESEDGHIERVLYTLGQAIDVTIHRIFIAGGRVELGILHSGEGMED